MRPTKLVRDYSSSAVDTKKTLTLTALTPPTPPAHDDLFYYKKKAPLCLFSFIQTRYHTAVLLLVHTTGRDNNVIQVEGVVRTPGGVFALAMPFFEHDDFRQVMKTLTLAGVAAYMKSLLTALAHVHAEGVIHRDIKPRNFMYNSKTGKGVRCVCVNCWLLRVRTLCNNKSCYCCRFFFCAYDIDFIRSMQQSRA